jgi:hypothetical protein
VLALVVDNDNGGIRCHLSRLAHCTHESFPI